MLLKRVYIVLICLLFSTAAFAKDKKPQISEIFVDTELNQLVISGKDFTDPDVSLGVYTGFLAPVSSTGDFELVVELPTDILAGDYKLTVKQGKKKDTYDLTIGAVGPVGPTGEDGADGEDGINGTNGATGADGEDGADGADGADGEDGADGINGLDGADGADGAGFGTFTYSIDALTCTEQSGATSGDVTQCQVSGTVRTDGSSDLPCAVRGTAVLVTYLCDVDVPEGGLIDEIIAYGFDFSNTGYMEAAVYGSFVQAPGAIFISPTFGGTFQNTGITETPFFTDFPIYLSTDAPHRVDGNYKYTIAMGVFAPSGALWGLGFEVTYTVEKPSP